MLSLYKLVQLLADTAESPTKNFTLNSNAVDTQSCFPCPNFLSSTTLCNDSSYPQRELRVKIRSFSTVLSVHKSETHCLTPH